MNIEALPAAAGSRALRSRGARAVAWGGVFVGALSVGAAAWAADKPPKPGTAQPAATGPVPASATQPLLSSPVPGVAPVAPMPPAGTGQGVHDPRSAFKPLQERDGVVSWKLLGAVTARLDRYKMVPTFTPEILALNARTVKVQGFMLPLEPGEKQQHFLLSAVPTTCNFCVPAGPEGLIEVRTRKPVPVSVDAITLQGRFSALTQDPYGLFYRVAEAELVR